MARKSAQEPQVRKADLTAVQLSAGVIRVQRRLGELEKLLGCNSLQELEQEAEPLRKKIEQSLSDIFGPDTDEYQRYKVYALYSGGTISMNGGYKRPDSEYVKHYHDGVKDAISTLQTVKSVLEEHLDDMGASPGGKARRAIDGLELHPEIERAVGELYRNGHYAHAIEDAVKALNAFVRMRSGIEQDGTSLMQHVFSVKNPVLKFNALADESDRNEQHGFMELFTGAVRGLRNPRAHKIIQDDPEEAIEFIAFISLLAKLVDRAKKA